MPRQLKCIAFQLGMFFCCVFVTAWVFSLFFLKLCTAHTHTQTSFAFFLFFVLSHFLLVYSKFMRMFFCASLARRKYKKVLVRQHTRSRNVCTFGFWCFFISLERKRETLLVCIWHDVWWMQNWLWSKLKWKKDGRKRKARSDFENFNKDFFPLPRSYLTFKFPIFHSSPPNGQ